MKHEAYWLLFHVSCFMANVGTIKELRELTGLSFNEIRKALEQAGGDKAQAVENLKKLGATLAEKKSARATGQGLVEAYIHANKKIGALVILMCETDFVARNPLFSELAHEIAMQIAAMNPKDKKDLLAQPYIKDQGITVSQLIQSYVAKLGENIKVASFSRSSI